MMRRLALVLTMTILGGCTTIDDLAPTPGASAGVSVRAPRFEDSKPHEWVSGAPWTYAVHGTDVSKYQTSVDWPQVRASGISFAFIKATEGGDRFDEYFDEHWRRTKAAGIPRAAYHFYYFCTPAAKQARWFVDHVPNDRSAMPPVLDMEWNPHSPTCKLRPDKEKVRSEMTIFLSTLERHYGKKPIIYTTVDFFDDNDLSSFRGYPYWLRSVAGHPSQKYGSHPFTFWQYTGTGVIPGMKGDADINVFNGSEADWKRWLRHSTR